jgi:hypothetical protein
MDKIKNFFLKSKNRKIFVILAVILFNLNIGAMLIIPLDIVLYFAFEVLRKTIKSEITFYTPVVFAFLMSSSTRGLTLTAPLAWKVLAAFNVSSDSFYIGLEVIVLFNYLFFIVLIGLIDRIYYSRLGKSNPK